jgi:putative lipoic acid-binding regulatory protein
MKYDPESLERLRAVHSFPCEFRFKVIGENSPEFVARVLQTVVLVLGTDRQPEVTIRESEKGRHQALTFSVLVQTPENVLEVYAALRDVKGVRVLL